MENEKTLHPEENRPAAAQNGSPRLFACVTVGAGMPLPAAMLLTGCLGPQPANGGLYPGMSPLPEMGKSAAPAAFGVCPVCGGRTGPQDRFCTSCGGALPETEEKKGRTE